MAEREPVGIITRADATGAGRVLDSVRKLAEQSAQTFATIPDHVHAALAHVAALEKAAADGRLQMAQAEAAQDLIEGLRTEEALHAAKALEESGQIRGAGGLTERIANLARLNDQYRSAYGHQWRAEQLREAIARIERLTSQARPEDVGDGASVPTAPGGADDRTAPPPPGGSAPGPGGPAGPAGGGGAPTGPGQQRRPRLPALPALYPGSRRQSPGALPDLSMSWAERQIRDAPRRMIDAARHKLRMASRIANALTGLYVANVVRRSANRGEQYEEGIATFAIQRGLLDDETMQDIGSPFSLTVKGGDGQVPTEPAGIVRLRRTMQAMRVAFAATGQEGLQAMRGLGEQFTGSRMLTTFQTARRLGLPVSYVAGWTKRMHRQVAGQQYGAERSDNGEVQSLGGALAYAGMRDRPQLFMEDVEAYTHAMAPGQRMQDYANPLGFAGFIGGMYLGGRRREVGEGLLRGTRAASGEFELAAKVQAVRRYLGKTTVGGGDDAKTYDPASFRQARELIDTADPRVTWAIARWSEDYANKVAAQGQKGDTAQTIFGNLTHLDPAAAERIWRDRADLRHVGKLSSPGGDDNWVNGPMYRGRKDGKEGPEKASYGEWHVDHAGSLAGMKSSEDEGEHRAGRVVLRLATNMKDAMEIAASGMIGGRGYIDSILAGMDALDDDTARLVTVTSALRGGAFGWGMAGGMALRRFGVDASEFSHNVKGWIDTMMPAAQPVPGATIINPVPGARPGDDLGAARTENGHFDHPHRGLDLFAPEGAPVEAAAGGVVSNLRNRATWEASDSASGRRGGIQVWINHPDGTQTRYMHLSELDPSLTMGANVRAGAQIGNVGRTGIKDPNTAAHLHFEVRGPADAQGNREPISPSAAMGLQR